MKDYQPLPPLTSQYPIEFMEKRRAIILKINPDDTAIVGLSSDDELLREELLEFHEQVLEFVLIDDEELSGYLSKELSYQENTWENESIDSKIHLDKLANDAPIINLVNNLFIEAIRSDASDIHIEGNTEATSVRYRIDGVMNPVMQLPAGQFAAISSRIKIMSNLNIMERRLPQDGRISVHLGGVNLDMRVSIVPISGGESIVLRLFNKQESLYDLKDLGWSAYNMHLIEKLYSNNHGLILFTGPTGSGKTTSLNAIIRQLDANAQKIITIEDPVEHSIDNVCQIQTNDDIGLTFHSLLRRVLRQDPNIIMIGEIRDSETAKLAIRASLTGHLVFSSLHTNDSISTIQRLKDMGIEDYLLAAVLRGAAAQRLVRKLCSKCKVKHQLSPGEKELFAIHNQYPSYIYKPVGCESCNHSGYSGRTAVLEVFISDTGMEKMIIESDSIDEIKKHLIENGLRLLSADAYAKAAEGVTSLEEIERVL